MVKQKYFITSFFQDFKDTKTQNQVFVNYEEVHQGQGFSGDGERKREGG